MMQWFSCGQEIDSIPVADRGFQYGDGLFETIAIREGKPRLWKLHQERLLVSCHRLALNTDGLTDLHDQVLHALQSAATPGLDAVVKIIVTRGVGERGYRHSADVASSVYIGLFDYRPMPSGYYTTGIGVRLCETRLSSQAQLAGMKTLSRLDQVLARAEWNDDAIVEGIMLDVSGNVVCGTMSNLFCVIDDQLVTPDLTLSGVAGVMRRHIISLADLNGMPVDVKPISLPMFDRASELFVCNSQFGILPVSHNGSQLFPSRQASSRLRSLLRANSVVEGPP